MDSGSVQKDFFISYTQKDRRWAEWVAWELEAASYSTIIQAWDFLPGNNFVQKMDCGLQNASRLIAILSPNYKASKFGRAEWSAMFAQDPLGELRKLLPVLVAPVELSLLERAIIYIDLVDTDEQTARERLLRGVKDVLRQKPLDKPPFPMPALPKPAFPGPARRWTGMVITLVIALVAALWWARQQSVQPQLTRDGATVSATSEEIKSIRPQTDNRKQPTAELEVLKR